MQTWPATRPHNTDSARHAILEQHKDHTLVNTMAAQRRPRARATVAGRESPVNWRPGWRVVRGAPTLEVPLEPTLNKDELHLFARHGPRSEEHHQGPPASSRCCPRSVRAARRHTRPSCKAWDWGTVVQVCSCSPGCNVSQAAHLAALQYASNTHSAQSGSSGLLRHLSMSVYRR